MATGNKTCETNKCSSCQCQCDISGGHSCTECNVCNQSDIHKRK